MAKVEDNEMIPKAARKQSVQGTPIRLSADLSAEILQARREWHNIFKILKGENLQPRTLNQARLSFGKEGEQDVGEGLVAKSYPLLRPYGL